MTRHTYGNDLTTRGEINSHITDIMNEINSETYHDVGLINSFQDNNDLIVEFFRTHTRFSAQFTGKINIIDNTIWIPVDRKGDVLSEIQINSPLLDLNKKYKCYVRLFAFNKHRSPVGLYNLYECTRIPSEFGLSFTIDYPLICTLFNSIHIAIVSDTDLSEDINTFYTCLCKYKFIETDFRSIIGKNYGFVAMGSFCDFSENEIFSNKPLVDELEQRMKAVRLMFKNVDDDQGDDQGEGHDDIDNGVTQPCFNGEGTSYCITGSPR